MRSNVISKPAAKFVERHTSLLDNSSHRQCVHGIVARNHEFPDPIRHNDVLALPQDPVIHLGENADRVEVVDAR